MTDFSVMGCYYFYIKKERILKMSISIITDEEKITAYLCGELDHHTAKDFRMEIDKAIEENFEIKKVYIDFSGITFMDSSGIGLIMGRYKLLHAKDGVLFIQNPPDYIARVMNIAGVNRLAKIVYVAAGCDENEISAKGEKENED